MNIFKNLKSDIPAGVIVFFVALPLCLGIALASGAPPFSGIIAGIIGGIVVGSISGSALGVSGPAAGLAAIVLIAISSLGGYQNFLLAVVLAGLIQIALGIAKAGVIGNYFPSSVIKGMLTGIGIIIIMKQIPHFFGYDGSPESDWGLFDMSNTDVFKEMAQGVSQISLGSTLVAIVSLGILILWDQVLVKKARIFQLIQGPLVAVVVGILYQSFLGNHPVWGIQAAHLVNVPVPEDFDSFIGQFSVPNFSAITNPDVYLVAATIALVASIETLLSVEATDKIDPKKRNTPANRELIAQGAGNLFSGLIGGLPVTQVIVRSSANIQSNAQSKMSTIFHGFLLLTSVILIPRVLNLLPLSVLAAVLFIVGYKLAKPKLFISMYQAGWKQFVPFALTVIFIIVKDLLWGIGIGLAFGVAIVLFKSYQNSHLVHKVGEEEEEGKKRMKITLAEEVTFFNKASILKELNSIPENTILEIDISKNRYLDHDILEILYEFSAKAKNKNISILLISKNGKSKEEEHLGSIFKVQAS
ncbi:SulP family inorganic anion transporter [Mangrovibacterium diazotrophicum]|uniref:MFS superfamily sulfate permease-like transporter n=1 Tax=Mangrovibacterium diazotrophicum TaxID=1261403 RepID=A0A419W3C9_9BACT|nr:SulP family inorganic anion transporter [Mangrovibacterium diazotrophicum]RKD89985.1 MFS superfamily sulfate permease-like transporter [Mangrovibacterium diazotrophicum]